MAGCSMALAPPFCDAAELRARGAWGTHANCAGGIERAPGAGWPPWLNRCLRRVADGSGLERARKSRPSLGNLRQVAALERTTPLRLRRAVDEHFEQWAADRVRFGPDARELRHVRIRRPDPGVDEDLAVGHGADPRGSPGTERSVENRTRPLPLSDRGALHPRIGVVGGRPGGLD